MTDRIVSFFCPVCLKEGSQFNNGWAADGMEKIECGYCKSQYELVLIPDYRVRRAMKANAKKVNPEWNPE